MSKVAQLKKPMLSKDAVLGFAEGTSSDPGREAMPAEGVSARNTQATATGTKSGLVPSGDVRLTANVNAEVHLALKIRAARERTTVGELIEQWVSGWPNG